jgi:hypothetical protein
MLLSDHLPGEKLILTDEKWSSARFFLFVEVPGKGKICEGSEDFSRTPETDLGPQGYTGSPGANSPQRFHSTAKSVKYTSPLLALRVFPKRDDNFVVIDPGPDHS